MPEQVGRLFALYAELYSEEHVELLLQADGSGEVRNWHGYGTIFEFDNPEDGIKVLTLWLGRAE